MVTEPKNKSFFVSCHRKAIFFEKVAFFGIVQNAFQSGNLHARFSLCNQDCCICSDAFATAGETEKFGGGGFDRDQVLVNSDNIS